tara:strand:+ start:403 stop:681 length:279 start_codon:yes stop_codon:yes gene_type:complete
VEFSSIEEAKDAIETLNGSVLEDRVITVREDKETSITADAASAPRRIFVGNLHYHTRWMDLKDHFQVNMTLKGILFFTGDVLFYVECCIRQL